MWLRKAFHYQGFDGSCQGAHYIDPPKRCDEHPILFSIDSIGQVHEQDPVAIIRGCDIVAAMPRATAKSASPIYQLKITLLGVRPAIWRCVLVPGTFSLLKLHRVIQGAMGWHDAHLHQFEIGEFRYTLPDDEMYDPNLDERRTVVHDVLTTVRQKFRYEYDFGDGWEHEILLENILPNGNGVSHPTCLNGARACPPEDVGGVWGYPNFLKIIANAKHPEHDEMLEWAGGVFDPEAFDLVRVNQRLKKIR